MCACGRRHISRERELSSRTPGLVALTRIQCFDTGLSLCHCQYPVCACKRTLMPAVSVRRVELTEKASRHLAATTMPNQSYIFVLMPRLSGVQLNVNP